MWNTTTFFQVLRYGLGMSDVVPESMTPLGQEVTDGRIRLGQADWQAIHREARAQTVTGIAFDGMRLAVEGGRGSIPRELMLQWYGEVQMIARQNERVNAVLRELVGMFRQRDIPFVVMKGQTVGALYPNPQRRQPGDIDIFVWNGGKTAPAMPTAPPRHHHRQPQPSAYQLACELLADSGAAAGEVSPEKHAEFTFRGIVVEVHHTLLDLFCPSALRYLERLDYGKLVEEREVGGLTVPCFKDDFNSAYLLGHMLHHLLTEGLGLRQVCDWMLLMKRMEGVEGVKEVVQTRPSEELGLHLQGMRLTEAFAAFIQMGIRHFGLDAALWGWAVSGHAEAEADKLLRYIMESGNFGRKTMSKKAATSLANNLSNAWLYLLHILKLRHIAPSEVRWFFPVRILRWCKK